MRPGRFADKKLWLLDMDGTIYLENELIDGALDFLQRIRERGGRYVFISNNSSKSVADYVAKVRAMGIEADEDSFFISSQSTALYLNRHHRGARVYVMGTASLVEELRRHGIQAVTENSGHIDVVLLGYDTELRYQKLIDVCNIMREDTVYLATNPDYVCPAKNGYLPDCGSMAVMLEYALHRKPKFIGKPESYMIEDVLEKFHIDKKYAIIVGDRLYTDIASGYHAGVDTICVLSGEATVEDIAAFAIQPNAILSSVKEIEL